ncbi:MAG: ATP-binding protein [Bacteroidota bacterium]
MNRLQGKRQFIQVLKGPRQVGKTTIAKQLLNKINIPAHYASADGMSGAGYIWLEEQWEIAHVKQNNSKALDFLLIIDEIQKIPDWSETVKTQWDADSFNDNPIKVLLLGSSALMMQQGLNESLAGRFELMHIPHWSYTEMKACFDFSPEQYVWFGGYPGAASLIENEMRWKNYILESLIETTISKDILMLTRVNKPALMKQVFELGVKYSSKVLSFNKMLGQLQDSGNTTTIAHYMRLLDHAGLLCGLPKIYKEELRKSSSSPKWQVKNTSLLSAYSPHTYKKIQQIPVTWGQHVESAIGAHLINHAQQGKYSVYYWRHRNDEVDYVIKKGDKIVGIEIKSGQTKQTRGMKSFKEKFNPYKILLAGTSGLHWKEFLNLNPDVLFNA